MGTSYEFGTGITKDNEKALYWYKEAARNGNINAMKELGSIYAKGRLGLQPDPQEARRWNDMAEKAEKKMTSF
ncbi:tetratricopeptide repeat protein [Oxalobacter formigenes]|uniref:tetratricopeptide repeat protein n=1 Tax=Oxalobacter formigenes TaxID=847 RepID=UPI00030AD937|nr:SEL1-like repeat protein [Oxalobacter formigenes]ARQ78563.1 hypothetical protein BRW84_08050 [Oxalobacter formigenes OXCC13]MCZ4061676.1 SEL1-like repeat protein [Oxalobacter formigenes]QDX32862.1 sel1 repeat family protein [Oxalobacter formigenes]WAW00956.1 SEL1-like repeat protein [Oxalobacter formigenes]WAW03286.1 SEL1-like repeat protein [Oxalobacter formigenes]